MKKFLGLITVLVALTVCMISLVACNSDSGSQATPQSIQFVDTDGVDRSTFWDLGTFEYGTKYADILPSYTVNLHYSDGSTKILAASEYTVSYFKIEAEEVPISSIPVIPEVGYYQIVFDKDEFQARMIFSITQAVRADCTLALSHNEWEYDEVPAEVTLGDYTTSDVEPVYLCISKEAYDVLSDEEKEEYWLYTTPLYSFGTEPRSIPVGEYYVYAEIPQTDNYMTSYSDITSAAAFTVNKAVLRYDSAISSNLQAVFNYRSGISGGVNLGDISIITIDFSIDTALKDRTGTEIGGDYVWADSSTFVSADNDGDYFPARYQLYSGNEAFYTVEDSSIDVVLQVTKGSVYQPSLSVRTDKFHNENEGFGPYPDNSLPYVIDNGLGYNVYISDWDENTMQLHVTANDGNPTFTRVMQDLNSDYFLNWLFKQTGKYTVTLSLKDKTNFVWHDGTADGTTSTDDVVFTFEIKDKKAISIPTVRLQDSATDPDGVDFVTYDGVAHYISFTNFTENAIITNFNGESCYPVVDQNNQAFYILQADEIAQIIDISTGKGIITVSLTPDSEYTWIDGSVTPWEYICKVNGGSTFFPGLKVQSNYTEFQPTDDVEAVQLMNEWFGTDGAGKIESDYSRYNATVYFTVFQGYEGKAQYIGTVSNIHSNDNFGTYNMSFDIMDITDKSTPHYYNGNADVSSAGVNSQIFDEDGSITIPSITDYDIAFFSVAKIDCRETVQSENITFAYSNYGNCTFIKIKGDNGGDGITTEKIISEVYLIFRNGEYVGHEINTTVTMNEISTKFFVQFAIKH